MLQSPPTPPPRPWTKTDLSIPRDDETVFARPDLPTAVGEMERNRDRFADRVVAGIDVQGRTLSQLRRWTRRTAISLAEQTSRELFGKNAFDADNRFDADDTIDRPLIVAGHQPELYHPGVWIKNFALAAIARHTGGTALNLIVDNDTARERSLVVPTGSRRQATLTPIPFDRPAASVPWEEARITDPQRFARFADRLAEATDDWGFTPAVVSIWPTENADDNGAKSLADALVTARHRLEQSWGVNNLELRLSTLCESDPFHWFASHLLAHLPRFQEIYNTTLATYREVNDIRSASRPVPPLATVGDWIEAPFWMWRTGEKERGRVFARQVERTVELAVGVEDPHVVPFARLPLDPGMEACCAVERLRELPGEGIRLRTRALTTTLFARLCLADSFIHGIGGAKYDEMTDRIIESFFGVPAPNFLTLSATAHLPLGEPFDVVPADLRRIDSHLRELEYQPERFLANSDDPAVRRLRAEKAELIERQQAARSRTGLSRRERRSHRRENYERFRALQRVTRELASFTESEQDRLHRERDRITEELEANRVLTDREFSFALYPEEKLRPFFERAVGEFGDC